MEKGKILKITFEYENVIETLSGDDAKEWLDDVNGMCAFLHNRGMNPFDTKTFDWIKEEKELN